MLKWVGLVLEVNENNEISLIKFTFFYWPGRDDCCWVPNPDILIMIKTLST